MKQSTPRRVSINTDLNDLASAPLAWTHKAGCFTPKPRVSQNASGLYFFKSKAVQKCAAFFAFKPIPLRSGGCNPEQDRGNADKTGDINKYVFKRILCIEWWNANFAKHYLILITIGFMVSLALIPQQILLYGVKGRRTNVHCAGRNLIRATCV